MWSPRQLLQQPLLLVAMLPLLQLQLHQVKPTLFYAVDNKM